MFYIHDVELTAVRVNRPLGFVDSAHDEARQLVFQLGVVAHLQHTQYDVMPFTVRVISKQHLCMC